jgi:hypothetical protein
MDWLRTKADLKRAGKEIVNLVRSGLRAADARIVLLVRGSRLGRIGVWCAVGVFATVLVVGARAGRPRATDPANHEAPAAPARVFQGVGTSGFLYQVGDRVQELEYRQLTGPEQRALKRHLVQDASRSGADRARISPPLYWAKPDHYTASAV